MSTGQIISLLITATFVLTATSLAAGWLAGSRGEKDRRVTALTTSTHNVGAGIAIAANNFRETFAVVAIPLYGRAQLVEHSWWHLGGAVPRFWFRRNSRRAASSKVGLGGMRV